MTLPTWQIVVIAIGLGVAVVKPKPVVNTTVKVAKAVSQPIRHPVKDVKKIVGRF